MWVNKTVYLNKHGGSFENAQEFINMIPAELAAESDSISVVSGENAVMISGKLKLIFTNPGNYNMVVSAVFGEVTFDIGVVSIVDGSTAPFRINFHIAADATENVINVKIRNRRCDETSLYFTTDILACKTNSNVDLFSFTNNTDVSRWNTRNFVMLQALTRVSDQQAVFTAQSRMPYINDSDSTKLDTITGKVLTTGGIKSDVIGSMLDSTYIVGDALYPSGDKQYYSVDDYTLIEV